MLARPALQMLGEFAPPAALGSASPCEKVMQKPGAKIASGERWPARMIAACIATAARLTSEPTITMRSIATRPARRLETRLPMQ